MIAVAREHNLNKSDGETRHKICKMTTHPQWNRKILDNDFGILSLCDPIMFDKSKSFIMSV